MSVIAELHFSCLKYIKVKILHANNDYFNAFEDSAGTVFPGP